jgi:tetratricopeptide (TPR) repeat protein
VKFLARSILIVFILATAISGTCHAAETDELFRAAAQQYEHGEYDKSIASYTALLGTGVEDGSIYYNMANCYLKKGDSLGKAVFFYEMARRCMPRDADLLLNLKYARSLMKQADTPSGEPWISGIIRMAFNHFTTGEAFTLWNFSYFGCAILFVLSMFIKRYRGPLKGVTIFFLFITLMMTIPLRAKITHDERTGFVITPIVDARLEPFDDAVSKFPLYEGMELKVIKAAKKWYMIKRPDGKVGWIPGESLWWMSAPPYSEPSERT